MGDMNAIVNNEQELRERVEYIINTYQQPALVEAFCRGENLPSAFSAAPTPSCIPVILSGMKRMAFTASPSSSWI